MNLPHRCKVEKLQVEETAIGKKSSWLPLRRSIPCLFYPLSDRERMAGMAIEFEMHCIVATKEVKSGMRVTRLDLPQKTDTGDTKVYVVKIVNPYEGELPDCTGQKIHYELLLASYT